jgi:hypothetical protein
MSVQACPCGSRTGWGWAYEATCEGCQAEICSECAASYEVDGDDGNPQVKAECKGCAA